MLIFKICYYKLVNLLETFSTIRHTNLDGYRAEGPQGTVKVAATNPTGCTDTASAVIELIPLGIQGINENNVEFKVYPNPARNRVNIELSSGSERLNAELQVYDFAGQLIKVSRAEQLSPGVPHVINTEELAGGIYFVKIKTGNETHTLRFTVL